MRANIDVDVVIVASTEPHRATHQLYADDMNHILISGTDEEALEKSLHMVHELGVLFGGNPIPVLTVGGGSADAGQLGFDDLQTRSYEMMDQPLEHQGWVRAMQFANADETTGDMVVPASLYRMMAGKIFPEGVLKKDQQTGQNHSGIQADARSDEWAEGDSSQPEVSDFTN